MCCLRSELIAADESRLEQPLNGLGNFPAPAKACRTCHLAGISMFTICQSCWYYLLQILEPLRVRRLSLWIWSVSRWYKDVFNVQKSLIPSYIAWRTASTDFSMNFDSTWRSPGSSETSAACHTLLHLRTRKGLLDAQSHWYSHIHGIRVTEAANTTFC